MCVCMSLCEWYVSVCVCMYVCVSKSALVYLSCHVSIMCAIKGLFKSTIGAGILVITASNSSFTPQPFLADIDSTVSGSMLKRDFICPLQFSGFALGRSTLFRTGIMTRLFRLASECTATVCACTPSFASTRSITP